MICSDCDYVCGISLCSRQFNLVDRLTDYLLALAVERTRGLVKDENSGPPEDRTRDCDALLLSSAEETAAAPHGGVEAAWKGHDELVSVGLSGRVLYLGAGGGRSVRRGAVSNILGDGGAAGNEEGNEEIFVFVFVFLCVR